MATSNQTHHILSLFKRNKLAPVPRGTVAQLPYPTAEAWIGRLLKGIDPFTDGWDRSQPLAGKVNAEPWLDAASYAREKARQDRRSAEAALLPEASQGRSTSR